MVFLIKQGRQRPILQRGSRGRLSRRTLSAIASGMTYSVSVAIVIYLSFKFASPVHVGAPKRRHAVLIRSADETRTWIEGP